ncbi:unnamed protein product [Cylindrotheca closterium]|uniref:Uncharacterized protein n=1 Tax=Cylindrotheca closterium TaxID=2856 RepID=A0AAD2G066_9STRA|nr:unnamed protein product [Cylindrotheca closterium]
MVKNSFDAYWEASQEGRDEIVRGIVNQFPPDVTIRTRKFLKAKKDGIDNEEQETSEGFPCAEDIIFWYKNGSYPKTRGTLKFEETILLTLSALQNTGRENLL